MEEVIITDSNYYNKDEMYCHWFKCTKCGDSDVFECSNYCSNCGSKIKWKLKKKYY